MPPLETIYRACILLQNCRRSWDWENACLLSLCRTLGKIESTVHFWKTSLHAAECCAAVGTLPLGERWIFPVNLSPSQTCITHESDLHLAVLQTQDFWNCLVPRPSLIPVQTRMYLLGNHPTLICISKHQSSNDRTRCKMF